MSASPSKTDAADSTTTERRWLIALLVLAAVLRVGVICWKPESLAEDRDMYWGIAQRLAAGDGYVHPNWGHPTAYRPPLYPLMLAAIVFVGGGPKLLGVVQIGLSVATVWLTWRLARKLGLTSHALQAAAFVALNPLLIQSTALAMTETLSAFLLTALLLAWQTDWPRPRRPARVGVFLGLAALCRPTVWVFAVLAALVSVVVGGGANADRSRRSVVRRWLAVVFACAVTVAPWVIHNDLKVLTTTHGGYTLFLGNNDEVYRAEIADPTETPWDSRAWQETLPQPHPGETFDRELSRDRWMSQQAREWIRQHPREFAELCWWRVRQFWNLSPRGTDAGSLPAIVRWGMAVFFAMELLSAAVGLWRLRRDEWAVWWPAVLLVASFALVHVVYWSNLRMRTPVEPALALLAARAFVRRTE